MTTVGLSNPWYLNSKGVYAASFVTYLADGSSLLNYIQGVRTELNLDWSVKIVVTLPKETLIKGIWWSTYNQDTANGILTKIGNYSCKKNSAM